jgi:FMN reductase
MTPVIVGLGGSTGAHSVSNLLLDRCLAHAAAMGAQVRSFGGDFLARLPIFATESPATEEALELAEAVRGADGVVVSTPGYHGSMSGLVKNALDHLELLRADERPYLDGRAVGPIVVASGWQACGTALVSVRSTVHALRGWPTPFGALVNSAEQDMDEPRVEGALELVARQLVQFAGWQAAARAAVS